MRTAAAQDLDSKISALLTSLDTYLALAGQSGEPANRVADIFWNSLCNQLAQRERMQPILLHNPRGDPVLAVIRSATTTPTVELLDDLA